MVLSAPPTLPVILSSVQAAGNPSLYKHNFTFVGTEVAALSPADALPASIDLQAPGYQCSQTPIETGGRMRDCLVVQVHAVQNLGCIYRISVGCVKAWLRS